jgi:hypothetical protein
MDRILDNTAIQWENHQSSFAPQSAHTRRITLKEGDPTEQEHADATLFGDVFPDWISG